MRPDPREGKVAAYTLAEREAHEARKKAIAPAFRAWGEATKVYNDLMEAIKEKRFVPGAKPPDQLRREWSESRERYHDALAEIIHGRGVFGRLALEALRHISWVEVTEKELADEYGLPVPPDDLV